MNGKNITSITYFLSCIMSLCIGISHAASVSWDGTSADITGLTATIKTTPNVWDGSDEVWNTTDEVIAEVGSQAAFKSAISQAGTAQRGTGEINHGGNRIFVGGGSTFIDPNSPGYSPSPWANLIAFNTTSFDDSLTLSQVSITLSNRTPGDSLSVRWFVEAGGNTYVSDVVASDLGTDYAPLTLEDAWTIEWFTFDPNSNIDINNALGASVGTLNLTDVDYVGIHQQLTYSTLANWHGAYIQAFSARCFRFFKEDSTGGYGVVNVAFSSTLAGHVLNPNQNPLTFTKISGPQWLSVASNGDLSGTPRVGDIGDNVFSIEVSDGLGASEQAMLTIGVASTPEHIADVNGDRMVDLYDVSQLAKWWLSDQCQSLADCWGTDTNEDGLVNIGDLPALAQYWLMHTEWDVLAWPHMGHWGPRMSIPTLKWGDYFIDFDVSVFIDQINQLTTASHVMVNLTHPADGRYFSGPHPVLEAAIGAEAYFPERDLLGEVLDGIESTGKKALVYFAAGGLDHWSVPDDIRDNWKDYVASFGMTSVDGTRELILRHYAERYGTKISGWWFDGAGYLIHAGNPDAIVAFNRMAGAPFRSTDQCDYFGGHPIPRTKLPPWDFANEAMVEQIEAGAWMHPDGETVSDPHNGGVLGHVFMPLQERWNFGPAEFPTEQAIDWLLRVLEAGGMYTWSVPSDDSAIRAGQFNQFLEMELAVKWRIQTPLLEWSFDMDSSPVGNGLFDLTVQQPNNSNNYYVMNDDTGTGTLRVSGAGNLNLEPYYPYASGKYDSNIHYVVKSTSSNPLHLSFTVGTSANPGKQAYVGISTKVSGGVQTAEIWTGCPPDDACYSPVVATGFSESAYLDITVDYDYETDTLDWVVTDGTTTHAGTNVDYTCFDDGVGGRFVLNGVNGATGYVDQLDVTIDGTN